MNSENELIRGIEEQTEAELRRIREELERMERDRKAQADREIEALTAEIEQHTEAQRKRIEKAAKAAVATEIHKIELDARERFFRQVLDAAFARVKALVGSKRYGSVLEHWIVEGAIGLAAEEAIVSTSPEEMEQCARVLPHAEQALRKLTGREVRLAMDSASTRNGQGVVLTAKNGRTAYNNQVRTRIMRRESEIRRIIYEELFRQTTTKGAKSDDG